MSCYLVGDVQGCCTVLEKLLAEIGFSKGRDDLIVLGDAVNRGPQSLATLRLLQSLGSSARCLLGNHDLHMLAVAHGTRALRPSDTLSDILQAPDHKLLMEWVATWPLAMQVRGVLLVHAAVMPQWSAAQTLTLAAEVEAQLQPPQREKFLARMYGNNPDHWHEQLRGIERLRLIVNVLTRVRLLNADASIDMKFKGRLADKPLGSVAWFDFPARQTQDTAIAFGHWSALGLQRRDKLAALDTGCVWGGALSCLELDTDGRWGALTQVQNPHGLALEGDG